MTLSILGQLLGVSVACGLNLYLTVATIGILSRLGIVTGLPPGVQGLESTIVIASALALYAIEAVIDKIRHADSIWDVIHTFIRPPAAGLLVASALWGYPIGVVAVGTVGAVIVALFVHATKAGARLALNATLRRGNAWYSIAEDLLAIAFTGLALLRPDWALWAVGGALLIVILVGPRFWRALHLGLRSLAAWFRAFFAPSGWREDDALPRIVRPVLDPVPLGAPPPKATAAAVRGLRWVGGYRNGWLVVTHAGLAFVYRNLLGLVRRVDLPSPDRIDAEPGVWADVLQIHTDDDARYTLFLLKDGPALETTVQDLSHVTS
ncbi:MAG: DUF4126 domain-containing protein [Gemmatimonadota bacterium]|jgi:hypothetical protein